MTARMRRSRVAWWSPGAPTWRGPVSPGMVVGDIVGGAPHGDLGAQLGVLVAEEGQCPGGRVGC